MDSIIRDYGTVLEYCIHAIFNSGMLLNEHDGLLIHFWKPMILKNTKYVKSYLISASLFVGIVVGVRQRSISLGVISTIPLGIELCKILKKKYNCNCWKKQFKSLIHVLQEIFVAIKKILQYYQLRKAVVSNLSNGTKTIIEDLILNGMLTFLSHVGELILELVLFLRETLTEIGNLIDIGDLNFVFNINLSRENFKITSDNEQSILSNYGKIQLAYIYVTSTFLCGFGLSLCVREWKSTNDKFNKLFASVIPECLAYSRRIYDEVNEHFLMFCNTLQKETIKESPKKADKPILNMTTNLKEYLQISFNIVTVIQDRFEFCSDNLVMKTCLEDLEALFIQCTDTLRVLQYALYKTHSTEVTPKQKVAVEITQESDIITIKYNEDSQEDNADEEFNLSIHGSDCSEESNTISLEYEQLLECVKAQKLMIRELNEELRKRNYIKQANIDPAVVKQIEANGVILPLEEIKIPPPLHLPMTSVSADKSILNDKHGSGGNITTLAQENDFLAQIRAAAANRGMEETVFEDDYISFEESSDEE